MVMTNIFKENQNIQSFCPNLMEKLFLGVYNGKSNIIQVIILVPTLYIHKNMKKINFSEITFLFQ